MRNFLFLSIVLFSAMNLFSQVNLSLMPSYSDENCFNISVENTSSNDVNLAGQNYRLYYDAGHAKFIEKSLISYLPKGYTPIEIVQNLVGNASGYGMLPFENSLGFINLATDYILNAKKPIIIKSGNTVSIAQLCFSGHLDHDLVWAAPGLTDGYATAFNEMSKLTKDGLLEKVEIEALNVGLSTLKEEMPVAFTLGNLENSIKLGNDARQVSTLNEAKGHLFKNYTFKSTSGKYIVIATLNNQNVKHLDLLHETEQLEINGKKYVVKYMDHLDDAKTERRRFINGGFEDSNLFTINEMGELRVVKVQ